MKHFSTYTFKIEKKKNFFPKLASAFGGERCICFWTQALKSAPKTARTTREQVKLGGTSYWPITSHLEQFSLFYCFLTLTAHAPRKRHLEKQWYLKYQAWFLNSREDTTITSPGISHTAKPCVVSAICERAIVVKLQLIGISRSISLTSMNNHDRLLR